MSISQQRLFIGGWKSTGSEFEIIHRVRIWNTKIGQLKKKLPQLCNNNYLSLLNCRNIDIKIVFKIHKYLQKCRKRRLWKKNLVYLLVSGIVLNQRSQWTSISWRFKWTTGNGKTILKWTVEMFHERKLYLKPSHLVRKTVDFDKNELVRFQTVCF